MSRESEVLGCCDVMWEGWTRGERLLDVISKMCSSHIRWHKL